MKSEDPLTQDWLTMAQSVIDGDYGGLFISNMPSWRNGELMTNTSESLYHIDGANAQSTWYLLSADNVRAQN